MPFSFCRLQIHIKWCKERTDLIGLLFKMSYKRQHLLLASNCPPQWKLVSAFTWSRLGFLDHLANLMASPPNGNLVLIFVISTHLLSFQQTFEDLKLGSALKICCSWNLETDTQFKKKVADSFFLSTEALCGLLTPNRNHISEVPKPD
jgi:hypothetical protein